MLNQNLTNNEYLVERIVPGTTHPYLGAIPAIGCIPLPITLTGTISTDNAGTSAGKTVLGVGTLFETEVYPGDFIYRSGALRKVLSVTSNTMLQLEQKFPASLSAVALTVPKKNLYKMITARSTHATEAAVLQEAAFATGAATVSGGTPLSYDVTTGDIEFTCSK